MRGIFSIFFLLIIIAGSLRFSLTTHFCGGKIADYAITIGKANVSCGMENEKAPCRGNDAIERNCCKNLIQPITLTDNFVFASINSMTPGYQFLFFDEITPLSDFSDSLNFIKNFLHFHSPPANYFSTLSFLRTFRI